MKPNRKFFAAFLIAALLSVCSIVANAQSCKDIYNNALGLYQKGQFENIENYLGGCIKDIFAYKDEYLSNAGARNRTVVLKVYKLIITSYKNLSQENVASQKLDELVSLFNPMTKPLVQEQLNGTSLTLIE